MDRAIKNIYMYYFSKSNKDRMYIEYEMAAYYNSSIFDCIDKKSNLYKSLQKMIDFRLITKY